MCSLRARTETQLPHQAETNLEFHLELTDLPLLNKAARLHDLEPIQILEGLIGAGDRILDGIFDRRSRYAEKARPEPPSGRHPPVVDWRHVLALEGSVSCGRETLHDVDPQ